MQRYEQQECIGTGAYSIVYKGFDKVSKKTVAIKEISHKNIDVYQILNREVRVLRSLNHPNIIKLLQCYGDSNTTYLIFQYMTLDLITFYKKYYADHKQRLSEDQITYIFYQICQALTYMHSLNLIHRDIKPQNILIDPNTLHIKLIDFGFATQSKPYGLNTNYMVTRWYRPLEIVLSLPYDHKADVFSLGALILQLYLGQQIFKSSSNIDQLYWICQICGTPSWKLALQKMKNMGLYVNASEPQIFKLLSNFKPQTSNILINMLQSSPITRISSFQLLNHPYFSKFQPPKNKILDNPPSRRISSNFCKNPQQKLHQVSSQPFLTHFRSISQKDNLGLKQISLSKNKKINLERNSSNNHIKTENTDEKNAKKEVRNTLQSNRKYLSLEREDKKRTKSLNHGLNLVSARKNSKQKLDGNNEVQKVNQPKMFSKIKDKLIENKQKQKNKISLTQRPDRKMLKIIK